MTQEKEWNIQEADKTILFFSMSEDKDLVS